MQRGVGGITRGQAATYTLSDGKKIQKVTDVVTGTGSVVRAVSFFASVGRTFRGWRKRVTCSGDVSLPYVCATGRGKQNLFYSTSVIFLGPLELRAFSLPFPSDQPGLAD